MTNDKLHEVSCPNCVEGKITAGCAIDKPLISVDCGRCKGTGKVSLPTIGLPFSLDDIRNRVTNDNLPEHVWLSRHWVMYTEHSCQFSYEQKYENDTPFVRHDLAGAGATSSELSVEDAAKVVYRKYGANLAAFWRDAFAAEVNKHGDRVEQYAVDGNCIHCIPICRKCQLATIEAHLQDKAAVTPAPPSAAAPETHDLYEVGGELYTFISTARGTYREHGHWRMAQRAQELMDKVAAHDKEVEEIARRVTAECKGILDENN